MNRKSSSGTGIFLMEMMVVVFFFIICASICILAFVKADRLSRLASERSQAVCAAESMAEVWKLEGLEGLEQRFRASVEPGDEWNTGTCEVNWNRDWNVPDGEETPVFQGILTSSSDGAGLYTAVLSIRRTADSRELFALEVCRYQRP